MSGTSVDSLDAALVDFSTENPTIIKTHSLTLPSETRNLVQQLALSGKDEISSIQRLDKQIALLSCTVVEQLCEKADISLKDIAAIGSHGQTIRHQPQDNDNNGYSLQVGDPNIIAEKTGITTVADFRRRDIAAGGHGAPLAPAFHQSAFHSSRYDRIILNTGGIANISYLSKNGDTLGYDTGPANGLMDSWCQKHLNMPYDESGKWARSGTVNEALLEQLFKQPFFTSPSPKSTGREDFNLPWLEEQLQAHPHLKAKDVQATLLALTSHSIALEINKLDQNASAQVYVCGGGSHNTYLMESLGKKLSPRSVYSTSELNISPDWVEAVAFAWLARQTMLKITGNLPSVTGAAREVILGGVYWGNS